MTDHIKTYYFLLGHEPLLSLAELHQTFPTIDFERISPFVASAEIALFQAQTAITKLGGIVKIASAIGSFASEEKLTSAICQELDTVEGKIHFGLSVLPGKGTTPSTKDVALLGLSIKKSMKSRQRSVRYVDNRGTLALSSASVINNGLLGRGREFIIIPNGQFFLLAKTLAVQPFEAFSERDFGRPGRDDVSGMLPPKLAMMMINCAGVLENDSIYDPSCGSGTIITEALLLGYINVIGSDISQKAISDTLLNVLWTADKLGRQLAKPTLFAHNIEQLPTSIPPNSVGAIISEPYMGPPLKGRETPEQLTKNAQDLISLYSKTFTTFSRLLKNDGVVIYSFPRFGMIRTAQLMMPILTKLGFVIESLLPKNISNEPFVLYQRDGQHVGREIWKLRLHK